MKQNDYLTLEDLLAAPSFRQWARNEPGEHMTEWEVWMKQNPDKQDLVAKARIILTGPPFSFQESNVDPNIIHAEWEKITVKTTEKNSNRSSTSQKSSNRTLPILRWGLRVAASIAVLMISGWCLQQYIINPVVLHQTPFGKQLSITLPDSTVIELNANSSLTYRKQNPRKVWLDGEAFFMVKKKTATDANFLVITTDLTVEVLGTAFNVLENQEQTEVVLEEGSIKLNLDSKEELYMNPGEMVAFSAKSSQPAKITKVKTKPLTSWKDGILEFEDVSLSKLMNRIEAIYGWKAVFHDEELKARKVSIDLPSEDLDLALRALGKAMEVKFEQVKEDKVLLLH